MARAYRKKGGMRKKMVKKAKKARARARENNMDNHTVVHKLSGSITPQQGLTVSNYIYTYWTPCAKVLSPPQSNQLLLSSAFGLYRNMYDQYRVNSVTVTLIPRANVVDAILLVQQNDSAQITQGKGVYYSCEDRDGIAPGLVGALNKMASVKVHKLTSRMTRTYRPNNAKNLWFDCQDPAGLTEPAKAAGYFGGITIYGESLPELLGQLANSVWADCEVSYSVTYRGKSMTSLTVNEDGSVTVGQFDPVDAEAPFVVKTQEGVNHLGAVDLSGNIIEAV